MRDIEPQDLDDMARHGITISAERVEVFAKNHRFIDGWIPDSIEDSVTRVAPTDTVRVSGVFRCTPLLSKEEEHAREVKEQKCEAGNSEGAKKSDKPCNLM